jgi:hypothetical protein
MKQRALIKVELKRILKAKELLYKIVKEDSPPSAKDAFREAIFWLQMREDELLNELQEEPNE